jgi:hypothetical protein
MSMKNPVTPPGIDPGTVRQVAQRLNHYATTGPNRNEYQEYFLGVKAAGKQEIEVCLQTKTPEKQGSQCCQ